MTLRNDAEAQWFVFNRWMLAVRVGRFAFALGDKGWLPVSRFSLDIESERIKDAESAISRFELMWSGIDPETVISFVRFGMPPPRPKQIRRWVCIELVQVIEGKNDFEGKIYAEFDDGSMQPISGKQLAALGHFAPGIKSWRLQNRPDFHTG